MVYKSGQIFLPFCHNPRVWQTDRQAEFSSLYRYRGCITCSAVKMAQLSKHGSTGKLLQSCFLLRCMECRHSLAMRKLSIRLPVCPSVKRVNYDKKEERSVQIFIPYERSFILVFWEEEWLAGATPSTWNLGQLTGPHWSKITDFQPIFARSSSDVTPSKKAQLTLIGSPLRTFQWA